MTKRITIAIDGHSSCGKSTMAKDLARRVGYIYVDTGAMYRSVTLYALRHHLFTEEGTILTDELQQRMSDIRITFQLNPDCRHRLCPRGHGSTAAGDGKGWRHRYGWP